MSIRRAVALTAVALLGGASSLLVGCGSGGEKLIPSSSGNALLSDLDAVRDAVSAGRCKRVGEALASLRSDYNHLPRTVDPRLRARLDEGITRLSRRAQLECGINAAERTTTTETTPETTTTETTTTVTTETTTVTVPTITETIPTTTTTEPPATTTGTGGTFVPTATTPATTPVPRK